MLSFYIHIPFCKTKCPYCSFQVCPFDKMKENIIPEEIQKYVDAITSEIKHYSNILDDKQIKSIYFGWGTPQLIWLENIQKITDTIVQHFDAKDLEEFSIEMNPYPQDEVLNIVKNLSKKYKDFARVRFSFGIQSFDNKVLSQSGRDITYPWLVEFLRTLQKIKQDHNIFNLDFIAFGQFNESKKWNLQLRNPNSMDFFSKLSESKFIDSYSVYTLELFPWSLRYYQKKDTNCPPFSKEGTHKVGEDLNPSSFAEQLPLQKGDIICWSDDDVYEEFAILKDILLEKWFKRYELSNFSLLWKSSIHNRVYREMWDYIWIWTSASSFIQKPNEELRKYLQLKWASRAVRRNNTTKLAEYEKWNRLDTVSIQDLSDKDIQIEEFFLSLRTDKWIQDISKYTNILVSDYKQKIQSYADQWFISVLEDKIKLTDQWMDIYNDIITELLQEI